MYYYGFKLIYINNPNKYNFRREEPRYFGSPWKGRSILLISGRKDSICFPFHGHEGHVIVHGRATGLGEGYALRNGRATDHLATALLLCIACGAR